MMKRMYDENEIKEIAGGAGGGGSQLYLHILENEDGLQPCGIISFRKNSYLKGDLDTSSWSKAIAGDVFALKGCHYMNEAYTNPFSEYNFWNPITVQDTETGKQASTIGYGQFDEYFLVTSDTVYKINEDGTVTRV